MARAQRTAELLAAAGLAPYELDLERQRTARENARTAALASLVPDLIQTGAGIAGDVAAYDLDKQRIDARNRETDAKVKIEEADALDRIASRKAKSAADLAKAQAEREKLERENVEKNRTRLESDTLERTRSQLDRGLSRADLERDAAALGVTPEVLLARADTANVEADRTRRASEAKIRADERRANPPAKPGPSAAALEERELRRRKLLAEIAALEGKPSAEAAKEAAKAAADAKKDARLTSGEATAVIELKGAQKLLDDLGNAKKTGGEGGTEINTGPLEALAGFAAGKIGMQSPEWAKFKAKAGSQLAEYIKSISGATVSEPERRQLLQNVPTPEDDDEEFVAKFEAVRDQLQSKLSTMRAGYRAAGRDTAIFDEDAEAEADALFSDD